MKQACTFLAKSQIEDGNYNYFQLTFHSTCIISIQYVYYAS